MSFSITASSHRVDEKYEEPCVIGLLKIGDYKEDVIISLLMWNINDYINQWREGLKRLDSKKESCLIVAMRDLKIRSFSNWWLLYKVDETVYFQNQIILPGEYPENFHEKDFYLLIPPRMTLNEDGFRISEWSIAHSEIQAFLKNYD